MHQAKHHNDYSLFLDRAVIQGLRTVKKDVKAMIHSINSDDRLKTERLYRYREQADILQTRLNKYIQLVQQSPEHAMDKTDPYIVNSCKLFLYHTAIDAMDVFHLPLKKIFFLI